MGTHYRILYVITDLEVGGVPLHLLRLAKSMRQLGHRVRVVSLAGPGPVSRMLLEAGIDVSSCHAGGVLNLGALWRLRREIAVFKPDIVHAMLFHANIACRLMAPFAFIKPARVLCEIQTVEIERKWHLFVDRLTHWLCRLEIGNSQSVIDHLNRKAGIPLRKLRLVSGGIDCEHFDQASAICKSAIAAPPDHRLLLWVGRLDPVKGLHDLLVAMRLIHKQVPATLALIGEGPLRRRIERQVDELGLGGQVKLLGVRHDVAGLLKACDVFVFPSHTEGMPNALLEAMAAGCPIVCTDVPGNRDLITHRENGIRVPPENPDELAAAVLEVLGDDELASRLGVQARTTAMESYKLDDMVQRYLSVYSCE